MKIKVTAHVHYVDYPWDDDKFKLFSCKMDGDETHIYIASQEVEIDVPDNFDPRPAQIAALMEQQTKAAADYQKTVTDIQRRISELQALEFIA
jgi:hypothetical protein